MNRTDFRQLANERELDSLALLAAQRWSSAYYLAGYAVECALKACICRLTNQDDFPDKTFAQRCYTHEIETLVELAGLKETRDSDALTDVELGKNWLKVKDWSETARYDQRGQEEAKQICDAAFEPSHGVMQWIKSHW